MRPIDADDAIKAINDLLNCPNGYSDTYDKACIIGVLEEVPTIEPKRGKLEHHNGMDVCLECGGQMVRNIFYYCPYCGAKMGGE